MKSIRSDKSGFTLIEVIVTLTVAGILSVLLFQFMGTSISRSMEPILSIQEGMTLKAIFEDMHADYKRLLFTDNSPLDTFKMRVETGFYGTYAVAASDFIRFENNLETSCNTDCRLLKITISMGDHSLTSLFAR
jgi:prepilin-type N-terminal cleavage/methylation domain-containing protein